MMKPLRFFGVNCLSTQLNREIEFDDKEQELLELLPQVDCCQTRTEQD